VVIAWGVSGLYAWGGLAGPKGLSTLGCISCACLSIFHTWNMYIILDMKVKMYNNLPLQGVHDFSIQLLHSDPLR